MTEPAVPLYHFADGLLLALGVESVQLVDLAHDRQLEVESPYVSAAERLALGWRPDAHLELIPELLEDGVLVEGPQGVDPVLHSKLTALDALYLPAFADALSPRAREAYRVVLEAHARRKRFQVAVGQCSVLPETTLRRALLVGDAAEVGAQDVLCIGDDDLVSVALCMLGHRVTVFDIDDYLLELLGQLRDLYRLELRIAQVDLRDPLEPSAGGPYDVFLTDPMSNRDFFEVFLSRGVALLKPEGRGYVAVMPPTGRLFAEVAGAMGLELGAWHRRHNRYYSPFMKIHWYESDWVEVRRPREPRLVYPAGEMCAPLNFYREDYFMRRAALFTFYDQIEDPRFARPLFLDLLMDVLEDQGEVVLHSRDIFASDDWSLIKAGAAEGHLTIHVDRQRRQIIVEMYPFAEEVDTRLRNLLLAAYKTTETTVQADAVRGVWDIRFS